jgi:organic radical activating enzyme
VGATLEGRNPLTCAETIAVALPLIEDSLDGLAITGGEPLLQAEYLGELLADARWPRPRMLETSGTLPKQLEGLLAVVDLVSMDIKLPSNTGESPLWDVHRECLDLARGKIYVKVLVDDETASDELERAADMVREVAPETPIFLQPITNASGQVTLRSGTLDRLHALARRHVADVRVVPQTHKMLGVL